MIRSLANIAVLIPALCACSTGPLNGTTFGGAVAGKSILFQGYTDHPNELVLLQVLKKPSLDPTDDANWAKFGQAVTTDQPTIVNGNTDNPLYYWSTNASPVPASPTTAEAARWPSGGLVRTRARRVDSSGATHDLTTFDDVTFSPCFAEHYSAGEDWSTIGTSCGGLGGQNAVLVSTVESPATLPASEKPDWLGRKGDITTTETVRYYNTWGAPATLADFKAQFGFPGNEVTATYYNDADLGLGREMHCKKFSAAAGVGVACYVTNYSGIDNTAAFNVDPDVVLDDAVHRQHAFATVAMVYQPPATSPNNVAFVVYNKAGNRQNTAQLDSTGVHVSIPNNCLTCHGISSYYDASSHSVSASAKFLPFDPFGFKYSTQAGFTLADQQDAFRRLNAMILATSPTTAISHLIAGLYAPKDVTDPGAVATDDYVPDPWEFANGSLAGTAEYRGIIKPGCRTCHISATSAALDFLQPDDWSPLIPTIRRDVCDKTSGGVRGHAMPQAERVSKKFWASGGRAYLITGFQVTPPDGFEGCDP
ncbi:MAG TPA: hypothetical protein VFT22_43970 [Kofleriaceae bacterium]|nr:hypothetical protein [Kofleriaceae bacterium]